MKLILYIFASVCGAWGAIQLFIGIKALSTSMGDAQAVNSFGERMSTVTFDSISYGLILLGLSVLLQERGQRANHN